MNNSAIERAKYGATVFLALAFLLQPNFVAAQAPQPTETVNVLDANSAVVATLTVPRSSIQSSELAVLINDHDPQSVEVAKYYQRARNIPDRNMIHLNFDQNKLYAGFTANHGIDAADFAALKSQVDAAVGPDIQALVISWSEPFRIAQFNYYPTNYSITSAFTYGIDADHLTGNNCGPTPLNPYYDARSTKPYTDFGIRPSMMLAGVNTASVEATIDKGLKAEGALPKGNGWFLKTPDHVRSAPRDANFQVTVRDWNRPEALSMRYLNGSSGLSHASDVLFYETGAANVPGINTNTYVPGALADHLTSSGGDLFGTGQMSVLRWLEAGVTASYGTVTEPCAHAEKFPTASVLVKNYFVGNTAVEAYTKSVRWPSEGVFVGDPLARPFGTQATLENGVLSIKTSSLVPGLRYDLYAAPAASGPFSRIAAVSVPQYQFATINVPNMSAPFYKLEPGFGSIPPPQIRQIEAPSPVMPSKP